jgi:hypothetical protein
MNKEPFEGTRQVKRSEMPIFYMKDRYVEGFETTLLHDQFPVSMQSLRRLDRATEAMYVVAWSKESGKSCHDSLLVCVQKPRNTCITQYASQIELTNELHTIRIHKASSSSFQGDSESFSRDVLSSDKSSRGSNRRIRSGIPNP